MGQSLMKSLLFNTNHLIYFFCPSMLLGILFPPVSLHYCILSHAIDLGGYGYYNIIPLSIYLFLVLQKADRKNDS